LVRVILGAMPRPASSPGSIRGAHGRLAADSPADAGSAASAWLRGGVAALPAMRDGAVLLLAARARGSIPVTWGKRRPARPG
jgi:hypothetical protein